ncbi:TetR/AcrR family transcriptional regulator [Actinophytocola xinjiangensis]|uniref:TetR/AcrR family transcriptional regulator n=1 Tax=Actinophytocola xinjiangensis TaxID=485602 RepID=UPI000ADCB727|nr:TetR/AcrR family transcriptional regulator [Actinophytocola xinjiangensis]
MRADARRNRERVLEAAETVFAEQGATASTEEVARRAGVGIGTVFRHFPTKEALYEAIVVRRLSRVAEQAQPLTASADPAGALRDLFARLIDEAATKKAFADTMAVVSLDVKAAAPAVGDQLRDTIATLLDAARTAGTVRADVGLAEVMVLLAGLCLAAEHTPDPTLRESALSVVFAGLTPPS